MIIKDLTKVTNPLLLDPLLRAALRVAIELEVFSRGKIRYTNFAEVKNRVSAYLSSRTHPYIGMYFWEVLSSLRRGDYKLVPKNAEEELMIKHLLPTWYIGKMIDLLGKDEAEKLFKLSSAPILAILLNSVLVPYSPRKGSILNVSFVFRIFHEYFLASYLVREKLRDFGYPENVKSLYSEIKSSHGGV